MRERVARLGVRLRPHVKTHKCIEAAQLQLDARTGPITVSTLAEARHFARAGFTDITYAVPVGPARLEQAGELIERGVELKLLVESEEAAAAVSSFAVARGIDVPVFLEVDCGGGRTGVSPGDTESSAVAHRIAGAPGLQLRGLLTHAGHAYGCRDRTEAAAVAAQERDVTAGLARRLRGEGLVVPEVSVGSTPTVCTVEELTGVTEVRPGNYVFFDAFQAAIGSCTHSECAFTVLASVIACHPDRRRVVLDAGALALSKDEGPRHVDPGCGFGVVADMAGAPMGGLRVVSLTQEHGVVETDSAAGSAALPVGSRVRVVPNHSCLAAALFESYHVIEGDRVIEEWRPVRGW